METKPKYYLTTAIPYTSRKPHIGNTYEIIMTDCIARYKRKLGYDVFFLTGTDEHGLKIETAAKEENVSPKEYVDKITNDLLEIWKKMNISYDKFIRTTDDYHIKAVQKIFNKLYEQGDIYKGEYEGWYCTPCESFWTETQATDGKCPDCGREVQKSKEEAYFLKLSKYQDKLENYIEEHPDFITPEARKKEMVNNFIKPGVQDLCVSRSTFTWGVPVEFDKGHVVYVWIDALSNYITALGYEVDKKGDLFKKYWPAQLQVIGKDILRFHTIYWPVILMALGEELPEKIFGHPWLMSGLDKMSKSRGNVMYADELAELFGVDAIRYYVLSEMPYLQDGSITYEMLINTYNSDLANNLGNLVNRTVAMINKYFDGIIPSSTEKGEFDDNLIECINNGVIKTKEKFDSLHVADAADSIMEILHRLNKYIDETTPWILAKDENKKSRLGTVMYNLIEGIRICSALLYPFIPNSAEKIVSEINHPNNIEKFEVANWDNDIIFGKIVASKMRVNPNPQPIFARLDDDKIKKIIGTDKSKIEKPKKEAKMVEKTAVKAEEPTEITIDEFAKIHLIAAKILECEPVEKSDKLLKLKLFDGKGERQVVSGIAKFYTPADLIGKKIILVSNLLPAKLRGVNSFGMILAASVNDEIKVTFLSDDIVEGSVIK